MQREMTEYTNAREYGQIQKLDVDIEVEEETIILHAPLRKDENIRIVYRSIPVGTTMRMEAQHSNMTIWRYNNRTDPEQIILLYNKMLRSNNEYEDFVETNMRYEIYQIEAGKMQVRLLRPEEWTQGLEEEIYQLFETRLQTIRHHDILEEGTSENQTRTFKNFRLVWNRRRMRIKGTKNVSRVMMITTNDLQNDIVVWKETVGNSYKSSIRLKSDQLNKFAILANIKG